MITKALWLWVFLGVQDDAALTRIQSMVLRPSAMCGEFDQQKSLVGLRRPVQSSGRFCVVKDRGVLWTTRKPFPATLHLSRAEIVESQGDHVTMRLSARDEPTVAIISEMLFSVLAGDVSGLRNGFTIEANTEASTWRARLVPKDAGMRRVVSAIELSGGENVKQITITEASGDRTVIAFTGFATGASALTPDEARALNGPVGAGKPPR